MLLVIFVQGLFLRASATGDENGPLLYLSGHYYGGAIEVHSSKMEHFRGVRPVGAGVDLSWRFVSEKAYSLLQCYPYMGASLNYWDFGHSSLGHGLSALYYVEPVLFSPLNTDISIKAGLGVSYLDHPYDEETNPQNLTYSTYFSFPLMIGVSLTHPLNETWALRFSGMFQHISNGSISQPNLGINYTTAGIGIQRKLDARPIPAPPELAPFDSEKGIRRVELSFISGLKEPPEDQGKNMVMSLSGEYLHQFGRINAWTLGGMFEADNSRPGNSFEDRSRVSLMAGHTLLLGRFSFGQKAGIYLWRGHPMPDFWYQYYTLDFAATNDLGVGVGLKAHGKVAELLSVRLLYNID